jgi:hypothetical protein
MTKLIFNTPEASSESLDKLTALFAPYIEGEGVDVTRQRLAAELKGVFDLELQAEYVANGLVRIDAAVTVFPSRYVTPVPDRVESVPPLLEQALEQAILRVARRIGGYQMPPTKKGETIVSSKEETVVIEASDQNRGLAAYFDRGMLSSLVNRAARGF